MLAAASGADGQAAAAVAEASSAAAAAEQGAVGTPGVDASEERFRHPSQAAYGRLQARPQPGFECGALVPCARPSARAARHVLEQAVLAAAPSLKLHAFHRWAPQQADPGVLASDPALAAEFEAAPWLLPPRTPTLRYAGVTEFDALLELRAAEVPGLNTSRAVSFLTSTLHDPLTTAFTQNCGESGGAGPASTPSPRSTACRLPACLRTCWTVPAPHPLPARLCDGHTRMPLHRRERCVGREPAPPRSRPLLAG